MIIEPSLWNDVPESVNWVCDGFCYSRALRYRPHFNADVVEWDKDDRETELIVPKSCKGTRNNGCNIR